MLTLTCALVSLLLFETDYPQKSLTASASQVLELWICTTTLSPCYYFFKILTSKEKLDFRASVL
jgi:hypothetical protein